MLDTRGRVGSSLRPRPAAETTMSGAARRTLCPGTHQRPGRARPWRRPPASSVDALSQERLSAVVASDMQRVAWFAQCLVPPILPTKSASAAPKHDDFAGMHRYRRAAAADAGEAGIGGDACGENVTESARWTLDADRGPTPLSTLHSPSEVRLRLGADPPTTGIGPIPPRRRSCPGAAPSPRR